MTSIREYQAARAAATAIALDAIPEPAPFARAHVEKLTQQGHASDVLRQLAREAHSRRRTGDLDSLEKHAARLCMDALENGLQAFVQSLQTGRAAYGRHEPVRHYGQGRNPVNTLAVEVQAEITWETFCAYIARMAMPDRPLSVQTLAGRLARKLRAACHGAEAHGVLGYERAALVLLDHFTSATGWIEELPGEHQAGRTGNAPNTYRLAQKFMDDVLGGALAADFSERRPMLVPPVPWTETSTHGGYLHHGVQAIRGVDRPVSAPEIVTALNALQATPFRVNARVLEVARTFRANAEDFGGATIMGQYVEERHDLSPDEARSRTIRSALTLAAIGELEHEDAFWFPWNLDWRGRMYPATTLISPQGSDLCKGLMEFAHGTPLGRDGARWLALHLCSLYGADKLTVDGQKVHRTPEERVQWVADNETWILCAASDPLRNRQWQDADKPWQFLAACFEYAGYKAEGDAFRSRIAGALDGSCSGVQMLAGMTRDAHTGAMVNLVPAERGDDYYGRMAQTLVRRLCLMAEGADAATLAHLEFWAEHTIDRDLLKAPSMTKVYSAGTYTFGEQIADKTGAPGHECLWLAAQIDACFAEVAPGMLRAMDYVQRVSDVLTDAGLSLQWDTPAGLAVEQARRAVRTHILTRGTSGKGEREYKFAIETSDLNKRAQRAGVSPNFVHGVDASHMVFVINDLHARGVRNFWMIHDSFGAPLAQCGEVFDSTRAQFARLMSRDLLDEWTQRVTRDLTHEQRDALPTLPGYGALDLQQVRESVYAWF